ncbi:hypothetical protein Tco_0008278 [Tanacetum coccineum]
MKNATQPQREATYQVTLDALKLSPCYPAFLIIAEVPEIYMHQFWNTIKKIRDTETYQFKLDKKKCRIDTEVFREILQICPILPDQDFVEPPSEDEMVPFIRELGYSGKCDMLSTIHTDQMHQPWRTFAAIINMCISGKTTRLDRLRELRAQILWDDSLLGTLKLVSKIEDYQKYGALIPSKMINQDIKDSKAYKTYHDFAIEKATPKKARKFKKIASPSKKLSPVLEEEPAKKPKRAKQPNKKPSTVPIAGVVIKDAPSVSVSKKKAPAKVDRGKGIDLLSDVALLEAAQLKQTLKKSKQETHKLHARNSKDDDSNDDDSDDVNKDDDDVSNDDDDDANRDDDDDNDDSDSERTDSDEDENPTLNLKDDEEEETHDDEYVHTPNYYVPTDEETNDEHKEFDEEEYDELYKDVNVRSKDAEHEKEGKEDAEMTDDGREDKTEGPMQSSSVSSDFASKFLNLDNVPPANNEVTSMMNVKVRHEESSTEAPSHLTVPEMVISETSTVAAPTVPPTIPPFTPIPQQSTPTPAPTTEPTTTSIPTLPDFTSLFIFDQRVSALENELSQFKQVDLSTQLLASIKSQIPAMKAQAEKDTYIDLIEKSIKDIIKDEVKSQLPQILLKEISDFASPVIQSTINESLENVILLDKLQKSKSYRGAKEHRDLYDALIKSYHLDKDLFESYGLKKRKTSKDAEPPKGSKSNDSKSSSSKGNKSQPKSSGKSTQAKEPVFEVADTEMPQNQGSNLGNTDDQPNVEETSKHDWTCRSRVELKYHFEECYKAVTDKLDWTNPEGHEYPFDVSNPLPLIKDQGRQVVHANYLFNNDLEYLKGRSLSSKYTTSTTKTKAAKYDTIKGIEDMVPSLWSSVKKSKHDVFSTKRIIIVTHVKVMKKYDYGYLDEIIVRTEDQSLHKFIEGDFPILNLPDIKEMLFLLVQKKLHNLERDDFFDLNVALWMFTRRVVILKRMEDLQLGVGNYQKKLNISRLETFRLMRFDELYKYCDGTLLSVRRVLHDIASNLEMGYLPKRRWSKLDRKRCRIMIKEIDQHLFERRLMRNLEKFV